MVRCTVCGHTAPFREGMRYCAACAAPLPLQACMACRRENFTGDRFCTFCAKPLPGGKPAPSQGPEEPVAVAGADQEAAELLALAAEARARAEAAREAPPPITKRHLGQDDIDTLFGRGDA